MIVRGGILSILILLAFAASACGGDGATPADAGGGDAARDAWSGCSSPIECDDGLFCNGAERCMPGASGAGADGCLAAESSPCLPSQRCDESSARCLSDCELDPDADGDGVSSLDCGGSDCDDADAERYPGATEICDAEGHDEDCDPTTLGPDVDGDGFVGAACCFLELPGGSLRCGADCDDGSRDIRPTAPESCNGLDDDCDGFTDEEVQTSYYPDCDGDGFGAPGSAALAGCAPPLAVPSACGGVAGAGWVTNATDCEDGLPSVHPGAVEVCNGVDDDCVDGEPNDAICGLPGVVLSSCEGGACVVQSCEAGLEDCDGLASNGCEIDLLADGMRRCGALCVAMTDPNACGSECRVCAPPLSDGVATCDGTICGARCASTGYVLVAGASLDCVWDDPSLSSLEPSIGSLDPVFFPSTLSYRIDVPLSTTTFSLTPRSSAPDPATEVTIALQLRASSEFVASGSPSAAAALDPGNNVFTITVTAETGATRAYTLTVFRGTIRTDAYLKASSTDTLDFFGRAVAVEGDTLVIGASREDGAATGVGGDPADDSALDSGAVYVFVRGATGVWTPQAYLKASNTGGGDLFGASVSISGDTLVIGAPREDSDAVGVGGDQANDSATDGGAAYVFVRDAAGTWSQQAYLKASNTEAGDHFGVSVALSGDTLVVGADGEDSSSVGVGGAESDNGASGSGAAYVFVRGAAGAWSQQAYLKPSNTGASDEFGKELAIDADTLVIAAHLEDSNATGVDGSQLNDTATDSGAAYVFVRDAAGAWAQQAYLKASNTGPADWFGRDVDVHLDTVVVGAPWEALGAGAAYVFVRDGAGGWSQEAFLKASNAESSDLFGECVTVGDGTIAVGAQNEDSNALGIDGFQGNWLGDSGYDAGAAYVFSRDHLGGWTQEAYLKASNTDAGDRFGLHIALDGRVLVVSTTLEASRATGVDGNQFDNSTAGAGAAYVFIL